MNWIKRNRVEFTLLIVILSIAAFLRFYRLDEYMTFLGDEGRDALIIKRMLTTFDIPLIGAPTSVGNMYLGPLYYYMMGVAMAIFWMNPVAAAGMNALIGVGTVFLVYYLSRIWFGKAAAFAASLLYSVSFVTIIYSRSSWNPNPASFFALLGLFGIYKTHVTGNFNWMILTGISLAFAVQMHYLALILLGVVGVLYIYELWHVKRKAKCTNLLKGSISGAAVFLALMSPLVVFDLKHNFMNYRALQALFNSGDSAVGFNLLNIIGRVWPVYSENLVGRYLGGGIKEVGISVGLLLLLPLVIAMVSKLKGGRLRWAYFALGVYLIVGLVGISFYRNEVYDHYLGFLNPVIFLLFGGIVSLVWNLRIMQMRILGIGLVSLLIGVLVVLNLQKNPLNYFPGRQLQRTETVAREIINMSEGRSFNFALIAERNYDSAYQFLLGEMGHLPKQLPFENTGQLFVVCEDALCNPIGHPKYEIASFGWAKIEKEDEISGLKVYKLVPYAKE